MSQPQADDTAFADALQTDGWGTETRNGHHNRAASEGARSIMVAVKSVKLLFGKVGTKSSVNRVRHFVRVLG